MKLETRLFHIVYQIQLFFENKTNNCFDNKRFPMSFFLIFLGFLVGNLFGTFLATIRNYIFWDGFIICLVLCFCEIINFFIYRKEQRIGSEVALSPSLLPLALALPLNPLEKASSEEQRKLQNPSKFFQRLKDRNGKGNSFNKTAKTGLKFLNCFKIGLLFGFFIDAFKVGS